MSKICKGEAFSPKLTSREVYLLELMGRATEERRIHPDSPTFTARSLANAMDDVSRSMRRIGEREVGPLLDRMGVFLNTRTFRRVTAKLVEVMPEWPAAAEKAERKVCV